MSFCAPKRSRRSGLPARRAGSIRGRSRTRKRAFGVGYDRSRQIPARSRDDRPGTAPNASRPRLPPFVTRQIDEKQKFERERRSSHAPPTVEGAEKGAAVGFLSSDGAIREVRDSPRRFAARAPRQCRAARKPRGCSGSSLQLSRTPATRGGGARSPLVWARCLAFFFGKFPDCLHVNTKWINCEPFVLFLWLGGIWQGFFRGLPFRSVGRALALNRRVASRSPIALRAAAGAKDAGSSPPSPVEDRTAARTGARE